MLKIVGLSFCCLAFCGVAFGSQLEVEAYQDLEAANWEQCKSYSTQGHALAQSTAEYTAESNAKDECRWLERQVGRPTSLTLGIKNCVARSAGHNTYWTCVYSQNRCCYTPQ